MALGVSTRNPSNQLREKAACGLTWQAGSTILLQSLQAVSSIIVASVVTPSEFALWGVVAIILNVQSLVGGLGFGPALINYRGSRTQDAVDSAAIGTAIATAAVAITTLLLTPLFRDLLGSDLPTTEIFSAVAVGSIAFSCFSLATLPQSLIERVFAFKRRAILDTLGALVYGLAFILGLLAGIGVWTLILGKLAQGLFLLPVAWYLSPQRPRVPPVFSLALVRELQTYGKHFVLAAIVTFALFNADTLLAAHFASANGLGSYVLAFTIVNFMPTFLTLTVNRVFFPIYVATRTAPRHLEDLFTQATRWVARGIVPTTTFLILFGPRLTLRVFGDEWGEAAELIRFFALYGLSRSIAAASTTALAGLDRARGLVLSSLIALIVSVPAAFSLMRFGILGVAIAFTLGQSAAVAYSVARTHSLWRIAFVPGFATPALSTAIAGLLALFASALGAGIFAIACGFSIAYALALLLSDAALRSDILSIWSPRTENR